MFISLHWDVDIFMMYLLPIFVPKVTILEWLNIVFAVKPK
jgi:hypothetical protein